MDLIIGSHVRFNKDTGLIGSVNETIKNNANAFMFYTGSTHSSNRIKLDYDNIIKAHAIMDENAISESNVLVHAPYIINLANNTDKIKYDFYIKFLKEEIDRTIALGFNKLVFHPGSHVNLSKEEGLNNIVYALNIILKDYPNFELLLEIMSGKGTELCSNITELSYIIKNVQCPLYVCLDTCHLNDSGIDLNKFDDFLNEFDKEIGLEKIKCIHINDSKNDIGMKKDRHENIGYGTIGFDILINIIYNEKFKDIPKILETPYDESKEIYKREIQMIREKKFIDFIQ